MKRFILFVIIALGLAVAPNVWAQTATPNLAMTMGASATSITAPGQVTINIRLTNNGSVTATGVALEATLPVSWSYRDAKYPAALTTYGDLAPGESLVIALPFNVSASATTGRIAFEAVARATNLTDGVEATTIITISTGRVLGASDQLAASGWSMRDSAVFFYGLVLVIAGLFVARRQGAH